MKKITRYDWFLLSVMAGAVSGIYTAILKTEGEYYYTWTAITIILFIPAIIIGIKNRSELFPKNKKKSGGD